MAPGGCLTCAATPADLAAGWPPLPAKALACGYGQSALAAVPRYLVRLSVVPDSSWRWKAWILVLGRVAVGLSALIAGSFHLVIFELKILAMVEASRTRLFTPERL